MRRLAWIRALGAVVVILSAVLAAGSAPAPQRRGGRGGGLGGFGRTPPAQVNPPYDGRFMFCRVMFQQASDGDGGGWYVDFPRADLNLPFRLSQLSPGIPVSLDSRGEPNHVLVSLMDDRLFTCPFIMMTEVGAAFFDHDEEQRLREYLLKGGFLWADDFWGEYAWEVWARAIGGVLPPDQYPIVDVPLSHPLFHNFYEVNRIPQIPSITFWVNNGGQTSERGADSAVPHVRAILNAQGEIMVLMTHNTDFGDAFEREGDSHEYFDAFAGPGYAFGVNAIMYSMTH
jgi:hypothetical protein